MENKINLLYSRRLGDGASSRDSSDDFSEVNRSSSTAATISQNLLVEIRQAVNEAQPKGKFSFVSRLIYSRGSFPCSDCDFPKFF